MLYVVFRTHPLREDRNSAPIGPFSRICIRNDHLMGRRPDAVHSEENHSIAVMGRDGLWIWDGPPAFEALIEERAT